MSELDDDRAFSVEIVHLYLYDIGRAVDLKKAAALIPAHPDMGLGKRRDTPASLKLPKPLILTLNTDNCDAACFDKFSALAKIYDDGALTLVIRFRTHSKFSDLASQSNHLLRDVSDAPTIDEFAESSYQMIVEAIAPAVTGYNSDELYQKETYTAFCILECPGGDARAFLDKNKDVAAALLAGEQAGILDESQVKQILAEPFSYRKDDIAVFDMDRCIIVDPLRDYEDVLVIAENANYRLIELRALDALLDKWLEEAEHDIRKMYLWGTNPRKTAGALEHKVGRLQTLRVDALFTLENLDNSSKIIGDYYLGQIYQRLCEIFNTDAWKISVERRLDALQDVYEALKSDSGERRMLTLEIIFIVVCIVLPVVQIIQVMLVGR